MTRNREPLIDKKGRNIKNRKECVPRWQLFIPTGEQQERYYEQKLLLNVPLTSCDISQIFSDNSSSKTLLEECAIQGLLDKMKDGLVTRKEANSRRFSMEQLQNLTHTLVDCNMISSETCASFLGEVSEVRPKREQEAQVIYTDIFKEEDIFGRLGTESRELQPG